MTASTALITDVSAVVTSGPNAASKALAIAPGGPIQDYAGSVALLQFKLKECATLVATILSNTDASDATNKTKLTNVQLSLA